MLAQSWEAVKTCIRVSVNARMQERVETAKRVYSFVVKQVSGQTVRRISDELCMRKLVKLG